jgi:hypothetical protein
MRQLEGLLAMAGLYAFRFDLNGDAREELSFKVRFGAVVHADDHDRTHVQSFEVRRAFGPTASSGASRPARRSTYWPRVGQEKQRRSRPDPEARPRQYEALEAAPASTRGCLYAEVRGSNPLSSTTKSAQIDVIFSATWADFLCRGPPARDWVPSKGWASKVWERSARAGNLSLLRYSDCHLGDRLYRFCHGHGVRNDCYLRF